MTIKETQWAIWVDMELLFTRVYTQTMFVQNLVTIWPLVQAWLSNLHMYRQTFCHFLLTRWYNLCPCHEQDYRRICYRKLKRKNCRVCFIERGGIKCTVQLDITHSISCYIGEACWPGYCFRYLLLAGMSSRIIFPAHRFYRRAAVPETNNPTYISVIIIIINYTKSTSF